MTPPPALEVYVHHSMRVPEPFAFDGFARTTTEDFRVLNINEGTPERTRTSGLLLRRTFAIRVPTFQELR